MCGQDGAPCVGAGARGASSGAVWCACVDSCCCVRPPPPPASLPRVQIEANGLTADPVWSLVRTSCPSPVSAFDWGQPVWAPVT